MLLRLFGIYSSTYFEVFAVQLKFLLALLLQQSKEVLNCKTTYREARLRDKVMGRLQDIAGMHVVMVGIAILHVTILNMMQHGFQHARGNLEQKLEEFKLCPSTPLIESFFKSTKTLIFLKRFTIRKNNNQMTLVAQLLL